MFQTQIIIKTLEDLNRCISLSSLLELSGWPKLGNVHRTRNFDKTTYEHFLAGTIAIQPNFFSLCKKVYDNIQHKKQDLSFIKLGAFYKESTTEMMNWQLGGNVLLGHILILAPLATAAAICIKFGLNELNDFKYFINKVIEDATFEDTINLYHAIRICKPGGLGKISKYDITSDKSFSQLKEDDIRLKRIFEFSKNYDLISKEYATGFTIILDEGTPYFFNTFLQTQNINEAVVNTFLYILAKHPDTLIIRKQDEKKAHYVSNLASKILKHNGISTRRGLKLAFRYDKMLQKKNGLLNPGTTADILAGIIFCALIFGLRF